MNRQSPRVLQVGKHFHPDAGGIETVTRAISDLLAGRGIRANVLATEMTLRDYPPLSLDYDVIRYPSTLRFGAKGLSLPYVHAVRRLSRDHDLAIVHLPNPVAVAAMLAYWRKPLIVFWHADIPYPLARAALAPFDRRLLARSAAAVALTPVHLRESALADALLPRGAVIGYPVDPAHLAPSGTIGPVGRRVRTFLGGRRMLLSVGRLVPYKGFDVLIRAARSFPSDLAAVIVGEGPQQASLGAMVDAAGLGGRVMLLGHVDDAELNDLRGLAFAGCMPSVTAQEMYGIAQVEFMALGKPVVATRLAASGVPWVNRDGVSGLLAEPGSAADLAAAVNQLAASLELYRRLSLGAAGAFARQNDATRIGDDWAELVEAVASGAPVPARLRCGSED
jgi:glycosyltransferase involved in cell wall biosynthesis